MPNWCHLSPLWWSYTWYNTLNMRSFINLNALCQLNWVCYFVLGYFYVSTARLDIIFGFFFGQFLPAGFLWARWVLLFTSHKASHFHPLWSMLEPDPAKPPPLTCAHDLASTAESLAIVVSTLTSELHMLHRSYDFCPGNLLTHRTYSRQSWQPIIWGVTLKPGVSKGSFNRILTNAWIWTFIWSRG